MAKETPQKIIFDWLRKNPNSTSEEAGKALGLSTKAAGNALFNLRKTRKAVIRTSTNPAKWKTIVDEYPLSGRAAKTHGKATSYRNPKAKKMHAEGTSLEQVEETLRLLAQQIRGLRGLVVSAEEKEAADEAIYFRKRYLKVMGKP